MPLPRTRCQRYAAGRALGRTHAAGLPSLEQKRLWIQDIGFLGVWEFHEGYAGHIGPCGKWEVAPLVQ